MTPPRPPPGWYSDPWGTAEQRYWDGQQWTGHVVPTNEAANIEGRVGRWKTYWNRGGIGRTALITVLFVAALVAASASVPSNLYDRVDAGNPLVNTESVLSGPVLEPALTSILLVIFVVSVGWIPRLFGRQPIGGRWWMWSAPVLVAAGGVAVLATNDYTLYSSSVVALIAVAGILVGFSEELLCRGLVVELLRPGRYSEWVVMATSSLLFSLLHAINIPGDVNIRGDVANMVWALPFGVCMYLTLRVTGNLIWPILMHALYDSSAFLATGWSGEPGNPQVELAAAAAVVAVGVTGLVFVRGRVRAVVSPGLT